LLQDVAQFKQGFVPHLVQPAQEGGLEFLVRLPPAAQPFV
jgi:hypothetical protein